MHLKYKFVVQTFFKKDIVAVPVGKDAKGYNSMLKLNPTGGRIIELLNEDTTTEAIVDAICAEFDADRETVDVDVRNFIDMLNEKGLLADA